MGILFLLFQRLVGPSLFGLITKFIPVEKLKLLFEILLMALAIWAAYSWAHHRGVVQQRAVDAPIIAALKVDKQKAIDDLDEYKAEFKQWKDDNKKANKDLKDQNAILQAKIQDTLKRTARIAADKERLQNEVQKFITDADDNACIVPNGFIRLFNYSFETSGAAGAAILPFSPSGIDGTPSGINLSQVANATLFNGAEAVRRGEIVEQWQVWYAESKLQFEESARAKAEKIPRLNELTEKDAQ